MPKKKAMPRHKHKDETNKRAIIWTVAIIAAIIVIMSVLLIVNG